MRCCCAYRCTPDFAWESVPQEVCGFLRFIHKTQHVLQMEKRDQQQHKNRTSAAAVTAAVAATAAAQPTASGCELRHGSCLLQHMCRGGLYVVNAHLNVICLVVRVSRGVGSSRHRAALLVKSG
jgi:hypothetical protein